MKKGSGWVRGIFLLCAGSAVSLVVPGSQDSQIARKISPVFGQLLASLLNLGIGFAPAREP